MTFTRANASGFEDKETITTAEINQIDANQANALDGVKGGEYSPSTAITLKTGAARLKAEVGTIEYQTDGYPTFSSSKSIYQMVPLAPFYITDEDVTSSSATIGNDFDMTSSHVWYQTYNTLVGSESSDPYMFIRFVPLVPSATLYGITYYLSGDDSHSALPARPPKLYLIQVNSSGTALGIAQIEDDSATYQAYDVVHSVSDTDLGLELDYSGGSNYFFKYKGEGGANSETGHMFLGIKLEWRTTELKP